MEEKNYKWLANYSVATYKIQPISQNKIDEIYSKWIRNKENNFNINLYVENNPNKEWKINFGKVSHILTNSNNNDQYLLSNL